MKELPLDDRPREKLLLRGAKNLSSSELIAILLRTGMKGKSVIEIARELLAKYGSVAQIATKTVEALTQEMGIGKDKAATIAAAFELGKRAEYEKKWFNNKKIKSPTDVAELFIPILRDEVKELFIVVCLTTSNQIIKYEIVSVGTLNQSLVHPREVFRIAIDNNSANIILIHNHPSGNLEPSKEDIQVTKKLVEAGKLLEINVFDHLIIGYNGFTSLVAQRII